MKRAWLRETLDAAIKERRMQFDNSNIGDPDTWSDEKWEAVKNYFRKNRQWPKREVVCCAGCGDPSPCKSDCPCGTYKVLE